MTETEAALAKATYEQLIAAQPMYVLGQVKAIMEVTEMSLSEIAGAIRAGVVNPSVDARSREACFTILDVLKLYFANILYEESKIKKMQKRKDTEVKVLWRDVETNKIPAMLRGKKEELVFDREVGQKLVKKMAEAAGIKAE